MGPRKADCRPNEVDIPSVVGETIGRAKARLALQPLNATVVYKPARPRQPIDVVVDQIPRRGHASSFDTITLVLAKPLHGVVPKVVGLPLSRAAARLRAAGLVVTVPDGAQSGAVVVRQFPHAGVAAAPKMHVSVLLRAAAG
jgi:hypothetical protein